MSCVEDGGVGGLAFLNALFKHKLQGLTNTFLSLFFGIGRDSALDKSKAHC